MANPTEGQRKYIYRVTNAALAAAIIYGVVNETKAAALLLVVNAVLSLADKNTGKTASSAAVTGNV